LPLLCQKKNAPQIERFHVRQIEYRQFNTELRRSAPHLHAAFADTKIARLGTAAMPLLDLWKKSPEQLRDKQVQQLIAFAGGGRLLDDSPCSAEFRSFLATVPSANLSAYSEQCLSQSFPDSGFALQDIINEIGARLGASITHGRYRGSTKHAGFDGLWAFPSGQSIVVEVKTTDAYRIDLKTVANYRRTLIESGKAVEANSSILLIVGRQDTGDLEAQIRGSRYAWDIRIISVAALLRLMHTKEEVEDPRIVQRIHSILIPREFTRLDAIADVLFSAAEDIKQDESPVEAEEEQEDTSNEAKVPPVAFHQKCVQRIQLRLGVSLVKRSRASYSSPDNTVALACSVSKEHDPATHPNYWFAFHPHQQEFLRQHAKAYVALGCGTSARLILVPYGDFEPWLEDMWTTSNEDRMYWHVVIYREGNQYTLRRKKGATPIDITPYLLPPETSN
jgi:hypothetical protein